MADGKQDAVPFYRRPGFAERAKRFAQFTPGELRTSMSDEQNSTDTTETKIAEPVREPALASA